MTPATDTTPAQQSDESSTTDVRSDKPLPRGYEIKGFAKPGDYDDVDMYEGINLNENLEAAIKRIFLYMLELWEKGQSTAAEAEAIRLLGWAKVPVLYRAYAHIVLAYGPMDNLFHASKAVEEAEWGVKNFGDRDVGLKLLDIANATLADVEKHSAAAKMENAKDTGGSLSGGEAHVGHEVSDLDNDEPKAAVPDMDCNK